MGHGHEPRRPVHHRTEVVAPALGRLTGVHTDPHPHHGAAGPRVRAQPALHLDRRAQCVARTAEGHREPVATGREHIPRMRVDGVPDDRVVLDQRGPHLLGPLLPQTRRTLDVGEQERHGAGRRAPHVHSLPRPRADAR